jgi:hypothetical protein
MEKKVYSSYAEIDHDLAIIKIEREIHFQKTALHLQKGWDTLTPGNVTANVIELIALGYSGMTRSIMGFAVLLLFKYFFSRKR